MTTETQRRKTFADEPAWNSGAALGFLSGLMAGLLAAAGDMWVPAIAGYRLTWAATVVGCALSGSILGAIAGTIIDVRRPR